MKGKIVRGLMIVSAIVSLCACGSEQDEATVADRMSAEAEVVNTTQLVSEIEEEPESVSVSERAPVEESIKATESQESSESMQETILQESVDSETKEEPVEPESEEEPREPAEPENKKESQESIEPARQLQEKLPLSEPVQIEQSAEVQKEQPEVTPEQSTAEEQTQVALPESAPVPHTCSWDGGQVTKNASCNAEGERTFHCSCGQTKTEPIGKTAHNYMSEKQDATCTADGYERTKCSICGDIQSETVLNARGHTLEERWFPAAPDCTSGGGMHWNDCIHCNYEETLPPGQPLGHLADEGTVFYEADCINVGKRSHCCLRCRVALPHSEIPVNPNNHFWMFDEEYQTWYCGNGCGATK